MGIIRFSCAGVFTSYYVYFMESYPTQIRTLGFGLNQTLGNLAGSISPIIIEFFNEIILYISFAILVIINIILTLFVPETVGKPMNETIEELEKEKLRSDKEEDNAILERETEHAEGINIKEENNEEN